MNQINELTKNMIAYYSGDPRRIQHFLKVHSYAKLIGEEECLDSDTLFLLESAALVHDIGIKPAEEKYGSCTGKLQEQEGPVPARILLSALNYTPEAIERICYLVAHHHTYDPVDGMDYRILLEADFLVNLQEENSSVNSIKTALRKIFTTKTGRDLCKMIFGITD